MNFDRLRFVAERAELGEHREVLFAVTIPEKRNSFRSLISLLGSRNVTEFNYRISDATDAQIFVGIQTEHRSEALEIKKLFDEQGLPALDITENELAKMHLRYMVGGHSKLATNERVFRFEFPERPGALFKSLTLPDRNGISRCSITAIKVPTMVEFLPGFKFLKRTTPSLTNS